MTIQQKVNKYLDNLDTEKLKELVDDYGFYVSGIRPDKHNTKEWYCFEKWIYKNYIVV